MLGTLDIFLPVFTYYLVLGSRFVCSFLLYCAWEIFDSHSLPRVKLVGVLGYDARQIDATYEAVMDDKPLRSVLARSLNWENLYFVDELLKDNRCQRLHRHKLSYCSYETTR